MNDIEIFLYIIATLSAIIIVYLGLKNDKNAPKTKKNTFFAIIIIAFTGISSYLYDELGSKNKLKDIEIQQKGRQILLKIMEEKRNNN